MAGVRVRCCYSSKVTTASWRSAVLASSWTHGRVGSDFAEEEDPARKALPLLRHQWSGWPESRGDSGKKRSPVCAGEEENDRHLKGQ